LRNSLKKCHLGTSNNYDVSSIYEITCYYSSNLKTIIKFYDIIYLYTVTIVICTILTTVMVYKLYKHGNGQGMEIQKISIL